MGDNDEIAELKARVAELERAAKPPATPDMTGWSPVNPIDRLGMSREVMHDMANAVPDRMTRDIAMRDGRAPQGPSSAGVVPSSQQVSNIRGGSGGWAREIPLGPSPHQRYVDAQIDAQDAKDRRELIEKKAREQALLEAAERQT